jgi:hypothetical protein
LFQEHCLSESRKYWTIVPKGYTKPIRLKNLGEDYTEEAIRRIDELKEMRESNPDIRPDDEHPKFNM